MRKPTGQMQEETQEKLDGFNLLYNWEYNEMCDFIESHGEETFRDHYETYHRLVDEYGRELVDNFADHFDIETVENFEEMYQGQHETGANFAESICMDLGYIRDLPSWVAVDWEKTWEDALSYDYTEIDCNMSDFTYGHIFSNNY
tara:strand:- start:277 stop:711 length:435 start_codon:yes stop_codon:yes gene_type:complete